MIPKSIHNNRFISPIIYSHIVENENTMTENTINIGRHKISILNGDRSSLELAKNIFEEVQGLTKQLNNDTIHVYIYLIEFPKVLDINKNNITSAECNSASTTFYIADEYVEVVIWRSEEWTKVLYHELIHSFAIDYTLKRNMYLENKLKQLLPHYNNSIREAYTEVLATILETNRTNRNIKDQCVFLGTQVNKIAYYMDSSKEKLLVFNKNNIANLDNKDGIEHVSRFFNNSKGILDSTTNTSSYYILKSIYLWYGVYKDSDLLDTSSMLNKEFINKRFYSVILEALENGEYIKWLEGIYFKPSDNSLRLTTIV